MGQGQSGEKPEGDLFNIAILSQVVQTTRTELLNARRKVVNAPHLQGQNYMDRHDFDEAQNIAAIDESDKEIFDQIFTLFDKSGGGKVIFKDFFTGLAPLTQGSLSDRVYLAMELYDTEKKGVLSEDDLRAVLRCINFTCHCLEDPILEVDEIDELVETSMATVNPAELKHGMVKYSKVFAKQICNHPTVVTLMLRGSKSM